MRTITKRAAGGAPKKATPHEQTKQNQPPNQISPTKPFSQTNQSNPKAPASPRLA